MNIQTLKGAILSLPLATLFSFGAFAEDINLNKTVVAGKKAALNAMYSINPNCTPTGDIDLKLIDKPEHGKAQIDKALVYPNFDRTNVRAACNTRQVSASVVTYVADGSFSGEDKFVVRSIDSFGNERMYNFTVTVKN